MADEKTYQFGGTATVSVTTCVEATSEKQARAMLKRGDCEWKCDDVDGDVGEIELLMVEE
jgi:hypothetical protein